MSKLDSYNRRVLEMANAGWPGGLRWLHGEDDQEQQGSHLNSP